MLYNQKKWLLHIRRRGTSANFRSGHRAMTARNNKATNRDSKLLYRADWEPEAPSGKSMAGVPGVFWRCPAVLQGPSTHNPALVAGKTLILKKLLIFPICMWKWGGSAPSGQARVSRPNWPQCAKSHAAWQARSSRAEKLRIFSKKYFLIF